MKSAEKKNTTQRRRSSIIIKADPQQHVDSLLEASQDHPYRSLFVMPKNAVELPEDYDTYAEIILLPSEETALENLSASTLVLPSTLVLYVKDKQLTVCWRTIDGRKSLALPLFDKEVRSILEDVKRQGLDFLQPAEKEKLIRRILAKYKCSYISESTLVAHIDGENLVVYWWTHQQVKHKSFSVQDKDIAELMKDLTIDNDHLQYLQTPQLINKLVAKYECAPIDTNLPSPPNIRSFHAAQLVYIYNHYRLSPQQTAFVEAVIEQIIENFSNTSVVNEKYLQNIAPLAMIKNDQILHQLLNVMVQKIRDEALFSEEKVHALTMIVNYADKSLLKANDVMETLALLSERLGNMKVNDPSTLTRGLASLNALTASSTVSSQMMNWALS